MIRPYQPDDKNAVLGLCRDFWSGSCSEYGDFDYDHTSKKLDKILNTGACFVTNDVKGFIVLVEDTALCNPSKISAEVAWYVDPAARSSDGIKLLKTAFRYCELKNIKFLSMIYMQSSMPETILKIYDKLGLTLRETTYIKRFA